MYYCGIDAHVRYLRLAVVNKHGSVVLESTIQNQDRGQLLEQLAAFRPLAVVVETCPSWPWLSEAVRGEPGIEFHLAHAKHLRMIAHNAQKTDAVDARLLARMLLAGLIPEAYPRPESQRERLRLIRHYAMLVRQRTALVNRLHAQLHERGLFLPREKLMRREGRRWLLEEAWAALQPEQQRIAVMHLELIDVLHGQINQLRKLIVEAAKQDAAARLLKTVPGIGPYWGLVLSNELQPIHRFVRAGKLVSYAGLAPTTSSSGGRTSHGPVPKGANRWVRGALVSAVATHAKRAPSSPITKSYDTLKQRLGWRKARVAAARKLARVVYQMLRTGEAWREHTEPARAELPHSHVAQCQATYVN